MYDFRDVTKQISNSKLPREALQINGQFLEHFVPGYRTLWVTGRESMSADVELAETGRANGSRFNYKRYPEREIRVGFQILADDQYSFRSAFNALGEALNVEEAELIFADEPDKYFVGTPGEIDDIEPGRNKVTGEFSIVCADPFKYALKERSVTATMGEPVSFKSNGSFPSLPRLSTSANGNRSQVLYSLNGAKIGALGVKKQTAISASTLSETVFDERIITPIYASTAGKWLESRQTHEAADTYTGYSYFRVYERFSATPKAVGSQRFRLTVETDYNAGTTEECASIIWEQMAGVPTLSIYVDGEAIYQDVFPTDFPLRMEIAYNKVTTATAFFLFRVNDFVMTYNVYSQTHGTVFDVPHYSRAIAAAGKYLPVASGGTIRGDWASTFSGVTSRLIVKQDKKPLAEIPNALQEGDTLALDVSDASVKINAFTSPEFLNPASQWDAFKVEPGNNTLAVLSEGVLSSDTTVNDDVTTLTWRERWL